jgi:hypothetical protein
LGFSFNRKKKGMKKAIWNFVTGRDDNTDAVIHSAVDGGCLPGEFVGERHFATKFEVLIRRWCRRSTIAVRGHSVLPSADFPVPVLLLPQTA